MVVLLAGVVVVSLAACLAHRGTPAPPDGAARDRGVRAPSTSPLFAVMFGMALDPAATAAAGTADSDDELAEAVLAASVTAGHLTPAKYRRAMEILAAEDAVLHPLEVPPESAT